MYNHSIKASPFEIAANGSFASILLHFHGQEVHRTVRAQGLAMQQSGPFNPKWIAALSPGLRRRRYPGSTNQNRNQPQPGLCHGLVGKTTSNPRPGNAVICVHFYLHA